MTDFNYPRAYNMRTGEPAYTAMEKRMLRAAGSARIDLLLAFALGYEAKEYAKPHVRFTLPTDVRLWGELSTPYVEVLTTKTEQEARHGVPQWHQLVLTHKELRALLAMLPTMEGHDLNNPTMVAPGRWAAMVKCRSGRTAPVVGDSWMKCAKSAYIRAALGAVT